VIRVAIVDDSALVRALLKEIVDERGDMQVVGMAGDPYAARTVINERNPDVLTLDVEMPKMNGLDFLDRLMRLRPMPVVMISSLTHRGAEAALRALELGAVDVIAKPQIGIADGIAALRDEVVEKIRIAAQSSPRRPLVRAPQNTNAFGSSDGLVALGASTGGTEAIAEILRGFSPQAPPTVVVQHMPPVFTKSFAARLNGSCAVGVREAVDGEPLLSGNAYIAPGDWHLRVERKGRGYVAKLDRSPAVNRHRPSVDALFLSVAEQAGPNAVGAILTGMGADGAAGLRSMRAAGAHTIAQDRESCVVFGMPKAAIALNAAAEVAPLDRIAQRISESLCAQRKQ